MKAKLLRRIRSRFTTPTVIYSKYSKAFIKAYIHNEWDKVEPILNQWRVIYDIWRTVKP